MPDKQLLYTQTHIPSGPSGNASGVAVGIRGGTVDGVGAIEKLLHITSIRLYAQLEAVCIPSLFFSGSGAFLGRKMVKSLQGPFIPRSFILRTALQRVASGEPIHSMPK